ncbi:protein strawberry notch isoform X2 [Macrosteles quadrilineatus]|uniref:protein strawberry notch isoform X2 n=1 Tax=Macrosteles quadrilineatus TaxID=74068 RepID=UPI0023E1BC5F|nr:protein strawberry notch isoform X2 [Macrosteles quadrilineatus]
MCAQVMMPKKPKFANEGDDSDASNNASESDFDEDEDPDKIEVPGGGKDLATSATLNRIEELNNRGGLTINKIPPMNQQQYQQHQQQSLQQSLLKGKLQQQMLNPVKMQQGPMPNKIPGGLVTKGNMTPGYEMVRGGMGGMSSMPGQYMNMPSHANMMGALGYPSMGFPGNMMSSNMNSATAQFLQGIGQGMGSGDMGYPPNLNALNQILSMGGMGGLNQLMGQGMLQGMWPSMMPNKAVSNMWGAPDDTKMRDQEEEENDDEDMGVAETYSDYMPPKLKIGKRHPDPVVETASLSSVEPTEVWYEVSLPDETIRSGSLSALQLEAITYAAQQHEHFLPDGTRAGFLIGDGAGVGKGRTIAGCIFENFLKGRKRAIWVSVSNDLKYDSERDLKDIGASKVEVYSLNKFKYAKISSPVNGNVKKGVIFSTYSALIGESSQSSGKYKTRLKQLLQWCGDDFDGLIVFDECHRAKNLCPVGSSKPTKTGLTVLELQNKLPKARVVYASATGASEPRNMAYMTRLGMWGEGTAFPEFTDFISSVEKRGVGAMEIVAMDMKLRGMYIARQLSFHGVAFKIEEVPLSPDFVRVYDDAVTLWVEAMQRFQEAAELIDAENRMKKTMWGQFWSSHQRFFKYLCIAAKVKHAVQTAREAVKCGKCVVIGLQSTGEARTLEQLERDDGELSDFVSTAKGVLQTLVEKHFPAPDRNRISRLLGLEAPKKEKHNHLNGADTGGGGGEGSSGGNKRKPVRQAAARAVKRVRKDSSDSDSERGFSSDSDFKLSPSEDSAAEISDESNASSDFNPFDDGSDSEDPWVGRKKKGKKKPPAKKRQSTQDKIDSLLSRTKPGDNNKPPHLLPQRDAIERACSMKEDLLMKIERLGERLPPNTLDQLIDELGGPENVAEMTGRKGRVVQTEDGGIQYESRSEVDCPLETLNLTEKQRFMDGEKDVAIISEAASSGISLQSDRRARNQRRRVHITLELPWSADRAIQQFGRTHRSNQVNAPEYIFLISDLAGERRFASIVAKRLESLGALTHGDRRATETRDLSRFNIDNKYGRAALEATMKTIMGYESPLVPPPQDYKGDFFKDVADALVGVGIIINSDSMPGVLMLDKDYNNMSKFLNRILGMPVELQNRLFKYFTDTLQAIISQAKKSGRFDLGILDLGTAGENVKRVKLYTFLRRHATGSATTELHIVHVERGMSWDEAMERWAELVGPHEGFYLSHQIRNGKQTAILALCPEATNTTKSGKKAETAKKDQLYTIYRPNTGLQLRQETLGELEKKYKKVECSDAEKHWKQQYESSESTCSHAYWRGNCKNVTLGLDCEVGLRRRTYNVLAGSVLSVWTRVENILQAKTGHQTKMQVVRLRTAEGIKIVGTLIPKSCVEPLREALATDSEKTNEEVF